MYVRGAGGASAGRLGLGASGGRRSGGGRRPWPEGRLSLARGPPVRPRDQGATCRVPPVCVGAASSEPGRSPHRPGPPAFPRRGWWCQQRPESSEPKIVTARPAGVRGDVRQWSSQPGWGVLLAPWWAEAGAMHRRGSHRKCSQAPNVTLVEAEKRHFLEFALPSGHLTGRQGMGGPG